MLLVEEKNKAMLLETNLFTQQILGMVLEKTNAVVDPAIDLQKTVHFERLQNFILEEKKIQFVLPAFPAKSPNREKTSGHLPDLGEVLALQSLHELCQKIQEIYAPGAEIIICSDGRVFSDLVEVTDEEVNLYKRKVEFIIEKFALFHLRTFHLEDFFVEKDFDSMRDVLVQNFAQPIEKIREEVRKEEGNKRLFNGIHRFIFEDQLVLYREKSKNFLRQKAKKIAYEVIQRSNAWGELVEEVYPEAVRLSIHPHHLSSNKLGIQMVACQDRWGTPWHNVVLFDGENYSLVKRKKALSLQAKEKKYQEEFIYFALPQKKN